MESLKNELTATYYQKQYQANYDHDEDFTWDSIIPEFPAEMAGALRFCKQHIDYTPKAMQTLRRLVEICDTDYADAPEVQKILPSVKKILLEVDEKRARQRKRTIIMWVLACISIIPQVIFWGWWAILSGYVTLALVWFVNYGVLGGLSYFIGGTK